MCPVQSSDAGSGIFRLNLPPNKAGKGLTVRKRLAYPTVIYPCLSAIHRFPSSNFLKKLGYIVRFSILEFHQVVQARLTLYAPVHLAAFDS